MTEQDPDVTDRLLKLAKLLIEQTKFDIVKWDETDDYSTFMYSGTGSSVLINGRGSFRYSLTVLNQRGTQVGNLSADKTAHPGEDQSAHDTVNTLIELYELARTSAIAAPKVIDRLIDEIKDLPPF